MKFLRLFGSTSQRDAVLASIDYKILQKTEGVPGVGIAKGTWVNPKRTPFYIEDVSGSENTVQIMLELADWYEGSDSALTIEKSTDGTTWETMGKTSTTGITATIPANSKLYLRCNTTAWGYYDESNEIFSYNYINTTGNCNVGGNIMSLLYGSNFTGNETAFPSGSTYTFYSLFSSNTHLVNASNLLLPAATLTHSCYNNMFHYCTSLTTAPALPATTLAQDCYGNMFDGCKSLTTAPALPATTLAQGCYGNMFMGCTSLATAPELPATTLANACYNWMFRGCTSLTTAPTSLPATTLVDWCYSGMFSNCTSLTTAPELPATRLFNDCYREMFSGCTSLNYIKCLATDISGYCTYNWVKNVAATGTFVKDLHMFSWTTGNSGIPSKWTVLNDIDFGQPITVSVFDEGDFMGTESQGTVTINGGTDSVTCRLNDIVTLEATPLAPYVFNIWYEGVTDNVLSMENPASITITPELMSIAASSDNELYIVGSFAAPN